MLNKKGQTQLLWRLASIFIFIAVLFIAFNIGTNVLSAFTGEDAQIEESLEDLAQDINSFMSCSGNDCESNKTMVFYSPVEDIALFGMGSSSSQGGFNISYRSSSAFENYVYGVELERPNDCAVDNSCICACKELSFEDEIIQTGGYTGPTGNAQTRILNKYIKCGELMCKQISPNINIVDEIYLSDVFVEPETFKDRTKVNFSEIYWKNSFAIVGLNNLKHGTYIKSNSDFNGLGRMTLGHPWHSQNYDYPNENPSFLEFTAAKTSDGELTICLEDCQ